MKHTLFFAVLIFLLKFSFAQNDTAKIFNAKILKKGFYKSYKEFIDNSPSVTTDFMVILLKKSNADSTIIGAKYFIADSLKAPSHVWGFCDGVDVYVTTINSIFVNKKFWKLEYLGPYPFFTIAHKEIYAIGPPIMQLATAALTNTIAETNYDYMVIDEKGSFLFPDISFIKKRLKNFPDLLVAFKNETDKFGIYNDPEVFRPEESVAEENKIIKAYLLKLNEAIKNHSTKSPTR